MTVTLVDYMKLVTNDPLKKGFIADLLRYSDLLRMVPITDEEGIQVNGQRWQTLPSSGFRKLGGGYTEGTGTTEPVGETMSILGGDIKVDKLMASKQLALQSRMKAKSVAFAFNYYFINGDHSVDPDAFEGMKKRVSNMPSRMTIDLASSGDSLKVLATTATENAYIDALHQAVKYVDGASAFLCNEDTLLGLGRVLRRLGLLETFTDAYGKQWDAFAGVPFVDVGLKADKSTEIITSTEDPGDGGNDSTSIYVPNFDTVEGLHAIQLAGTGMNVYDPLNGAEMESGPQFLRRIDWPVGLFNLSQFCIARIKGFKLAAA
jgi:hypothetical protein